MDPSKKCTRCGMSYGAHRCQIGAALAPRLCPTLQNGSQFSTRAAAKAIRFTEEQATEVLAAHKALDGFGVTEETVRLCQKLASATRCIRNGKKDMAVKVLASECDDMIASLIPVVATLEAASWETNESLPALRTLETVICKLKRSRGDFTR